MPIEIAPNRIELSDLSGGFAPDPEEAALPTIASPDVLNLLRDPGSGSPELRKGYRRLDAFTDPTTLSGMPTTHWIRHLNYYEFISSGSRKRRLIAVLSDGSTNADNIQIWQYDLDADTWARIDTPGRTWTHGHTEHWYAVIQGVYYGGTRGDVIYSYDGATSTWSADPSTGNFKTWVDGVDASINTGTQYGRDYAFKKGTQVAYNSKMYVAARSVRYDDIWTSGEHYRRGDKVSRQAAWGQSGTPKYWKSFVCIKEHDADSNNQPGDGATTAAHWKKDRLANILDDSGDISEDWFFLPLPGKSSVGTFHGDRLWVRRDDEDDWSRLQYSAPLRPEKNKEVSDLTFDPTDWAPQDDIDGDGGGWLPVYGQDGDAIRAIKSFGNYLVICKRWESYVLIGTNEQTWTLRRLGDFGTVGPQSICEHEGLIYFLSPGGSLCRTDGTAIEEVPGTEKVREWLKTRLDDILVGQDDQNWEPTLVSYGRLVWISLADPTGDDYTLVYDPRTQAFWLTDLPVLDMTTGAADRAQRLWFSTAYDGSNGYAGIFEYGDDPGDEFWTDDDRDMTTSHSQENGIDWFFRTAWFQFGTARLERRIRRVWALVKSGSLTTITVEGFRNFDGDASVTSKDRTPAGIHVAEFIEGRTQADSYAVSIKVSGTATDDVTLYGFGIDTEPRRTRFHRG